MPAKTRNSWPPILRHVLKKALPDRIYRRHIGRHDDESLRLWTVLAAEVPANRAILDIGAFRGVYALAARHVNRSGKVYAFEPNPDSASRLRTLCDGERIEVIELALTDRDGTVQFACAAAQSQIVRVRGGISSPTPQEAVAVTAVTLDSWVESTGAAPILIKIDVEGSEGAVLRSAQRVLHECQPIILCEVLSDGAGGEVMSALPPGYAYYYIDENRRAERQEQIVRKCWRNTNWLLAPDHRKLPAASNIAGSL